MKENLLLLAINTGYSSQKGRIIRKILNGKVMSNEIIKRIIIIACNIIVVATILFGILYRYMFDDRNSIHFILLMFADRLIRAIPSSLVITINNLHAILLTRYSSNNIIGTDPQKTI